MILESAEQVDPDAVVPLMHSVMHSPITALLELAVTAFSVEQAAVRPSVLVVVPEEQSVVPILEIVVPNVSNSAAVSIFASAVLKSSTDGVPPARRVARPPVNCEPINVDALAISPKALSEVLPV